jgi:hypothetical protein
VLLNARERACAAPSAAFSLLGPLSSPPLALLDLLLPHLSLLRLRELPALAGVALKSL